MYLKSVESFSCKTSIFSFNSFRLKVQQKDRPNSYDDILSSAALHSIPREITHGEAEMVKNVIERIPPVSEN